MSNFKGYSQLPFHSDLRTLWNQSTLPTILQVLRSIKRECLFYVFYIVNMSSTQGNIILETDY